MLTPEKSHHIFDRIKKFSSVDEVEVLFSSTNYALTRFANNTIHQNVAELSEAVSIRVAFDGKTARATTNRFDDEGLQRAVRSAESIARVQEPDADRMPMCSASEAAPAASAPERWFAQTAATTPDVRAQAVGDIVAVAKKTGLTAAGIYSSADSMDGIINSRGLSAFHRQTSAEVSITMLAPDSSGWQKFNSPDVTTVDHLRLAEVAAQKARDSRTPRELSPGKYTVVLEPSAVLDLVGFMFYDFSGLAILDQRSFLNNRIGTRLFGENISIADDVFHPLQSGSPFDGEGVARKKIVLVENGVVRNVVHARGTAEKMRRSQYAGKSGGIIATGHGFALPNEVGEAPLNIVFATPGNEQTTEQMIAGVDRGILITRLWYIREVEPYEKILTGMTRDGTFLIEKGKVACGIRNFRFNQGLIEMLNSVEVMGRAVRACGEEAFDMVVPAMQIRGFNFTEVTRF
ncbi:MAG TPA: TldD/PmbA family protein [Candidatus Saccharimonadales bacterium]|jgi:PmbA protein|nr:TldD/PmbA family protein [Candidatus Saccharimonadales bacterium]